jgi:hypothetical protein
MKMGERLCSEPVERQASGPSKPPYEAPSQSSNERPEMKICNIRNIHNSIQNGSNRFLDFFISLSYATSEADSN